MRLAALGLSNFKSFGGDHRLAFRDGGSSRPVYLIGGLNGSGKTTLAQATVLALHGERAAGLPGLFPTGRDSRKRYRSWLSSAFNQRARASGEDQMKAWVHLVDGRTELTITRSWWFDAAGTYLEEQLEVREDIRSGTTLLVDEDAQALVDEVLPRHLLDFAIFDGEQVRRIDDTLSATAVRGALDRLLNLDAVERTRAEIERLVRERRLAQADPAQVEAYELLRRQLEEHSVLREESVEKLRVADDEQDRMQRELDQLAQTFDAALDAASRPGQLSADLIGLRERRNGLKSQLGRHLGEWLYLMPVFPDVSRIVDDVSTQRTQRTGRERIKLGLEAVESVSEELGGDARLCRGIGAAAVKEVRAWLSATIEERRRNLDEAIIEGESLPFSQFSDAELADIDAAAMATNRELTDVQELAADLLRVDRRIREMEDMLAAADRDSTTTHLLRRRDELNVLIGEQRALAEQLRGELDRNETSLASLRSQLSHLEQRLSVSDDGYLWLETAEATVAALNEFLAQARADASQAVRDRMLRNLKILLRKDGLVTDVIIDPITHATRLIGRDGADVDLPSAGEQQLAAMAFIDAVLAAAENPLPIFVDTPLARLDSHHRLAVVRDFWPSLGSQVIVLSTDEEVVDDLLAVAQPSVAATYRTECDKQGCSSIVLDEYVKAAAS